MINHVNSVRGLTDGELTSEPVEFLAPFNCPKSLASHPLAIPIDG